MLRVLDVRSRACKSFTLRSWRKTKVERRLVSALSIVPFERRKPKQEDVIIVVGLVVRRLDTRPQLDDGIRRAWPEQLIDIVLDALVFGRFERGVWWHGATRDRRQWCRANRTDAAAGDALLTGGARRRPPYRSRLRSDRLLLLWFGSQRLTVGPVGFEPEQPIAADYRRYDEGLRDGRRRQARFVTSNFDLDKGVASTYRATGLEGQLRDVFRLFLPGVLRRRLCSSARVAPILAAIKSR